MPSTQASASIRAARVPTYDIPNGARAANRTMFAGLAKSMERQSSSVLFTPFDLGRSRLRNRIVMAPLTRDRATPGSDAPNALNTEYYRQRATAGLIIAEVEMDDESDKPELPDWVGEEVTGQYRYSNQALALQFEHEYHGL